MTRHIHADLMMQYAQDAMETDKPWERWESSCSGGEFWGQMPRFPAFDPDHQYRRKPRTIRIGEYDVPEPVREPLETGAKYWVTTLEWGSRESTWFNDSADQSRLDRGHVYLNRGDAEMCCEAIISLLRAPE